MPDILIRGDAAKNQIEEELQMQIKLNDIAERIADVKSSLRFKIQASEQIGNQLEHLIHNVERHSKGMGLLSHTLSDSINKYDKTESKIIAHTSSMNPSDKAKNSNSNGSVNRGMNEQSKSESKGFFEKLLEDGKVEDSLISNTIKFGGSIFGINAGIESTDKFLGYVAKMGAESNFNIMEGDAAAVAKASLEGYLYQGEVKGNIGLLSNKYTETVGSGKVEGELSASLMKDNEFQPGINAKLSGELKGITASDEIQFGTDEYNAHSSIEGTLGDVKGEAGIGIGDLGLDKDGDQLYGAQAKAGWEASLLKGEVKSGYTVCGIKIDAGIEGKLISAGAEAGASITNKSANVNIGASAGLGAEVKINVDWSEFKAPDLGWLLDW
jgi:hypothetical protein